MDSCGAPAEMRRGSEEKLRGGEALDKLHGAAAKRTLPQRVNGQRRRGGARCWRMGLLEQARTEWEGGQVHRYHPGRNKFGSLSIVIGSTLGFGLALPLIAESNTVLTLSVALLSMGRWLVRWPTRIFSIAMTILTPLSCLHNLLCWTTALKTAGKAYDAQADAPSAMAVSASPPGVPPLS